MGLMQVARNRLGMTSRKYVLVLDKIPPSDTEKFPDILARKALKAKVRLELDRVVWPWCIIVAAGRPKKLAEFERELDIWEFLMHVKVRNLEKQGGA